MSLIVSYISVAGRLRQQGVCVCVCVELFVSLIVSYISVAGRLRQHGMCVCVCVCGAFCVPDCQLLYISISWSTSPTGCVCVCGAFCVPDCQLHQR